MVGVPSQNKVPSAFSTFPGGKEHGKEVKKLQLGFAFIIRSFSWLRIKYPKEKRGTIFQLQLNGEEWDVLGMFP